MRNPVCAGTFYSQTRAELNSELNLLFQENAEYFDDAKGIIVPHAGYLFSGQVAASVYKAISGTRKRNFVILGVDHYGTNIIATSKENWNTPLGTAKVNIPFVERITKEHGLMIAENEMMKEHSIEVQLPFLQYLFKEFSFVPVQLPTLPYNEILELAEILNDKDSFFIASSDFTHYGRQYGFMPKESIYGPNEYVKKLDDEIIKLIQEFNPRKFFDYIESKESNVCGYIPIALLLEILKKLGANKILKIKYDTSFSATHDVSAIIGYSGLIIR
ncbi:MAG: AmmeMemoRadiSam system protein B [Candidatus Aenigmarchaeota archaeon]|nr:AmmeMemoRadiSam system protein B [Candidatus Aenigmarchaeota archaeon]